MLKFTPDGKVRFATSLDAYTCIEERRQLADALDECVEALRCARLTAYYDQKNEICTNVLRKIGAENG